MNANDNRPVNANESRKASMDLTDSPHDLERMQPEEVTLDLPDVEDIPGQEHIKPPRIGMMADVTISSADEEAIGLLDDENGDDFDISEDEKMLLDHAGDAGTDRERRLTDQLSLDEVDTDGDPLQESSLRQDSTGNDMDMAAATDNEDIGVGEEDEDMGKAGNYGKNDAQNPVLPS